MREDGSVLVDGQCSFYDFLAHFGLEDVYSSAEYNTISGLILDELEHIPHSGNTFNGSVSGSKSWIWTEHV